MKDIFWNKHRKFSIRKLKIGIASVTVGLVFVNPVTGMNHVEAALSVEDSNYINETAVNNGALVEYIRQALATISKAANSTVLPSSIQNLKDKVQALSTKKEADYTESAWQEFQGKLTTAKSKLEEAEKAYNQSVTIKPNASSYETTINELITSYPEYNTVVIKVREGETTEVAENRHLTNIRRINQVLTAKYAELKETAQLVKSVLPPVGGDIAAQQLNIINSAESVLELNKKESTVAQDQHTDLMAGLLENHKVTLSNLSNLRGNITSEDQAKIKAFLESHNPSAGETDVFQAFSGALGYKFNNDGTITITYTDDGSSDTVPLSIFAKGGSTQTDSPAATYSVTYNYVSGTSDKSLPSSITAPAVVNDKHTGDVVASPTGQTDVEDAANQGTWHFNGWDKSSVTIGTANETVTGTWNFIPTPPAATYSVTYNYVSGTPEQSLPSGITAPTAVSDKHTGDVVASPTGQVDVTDSANQGTWHFKGWDKSSVTVGTTNETVTGTWNFIPMPPAATYTVTYNYVSGTPDKNLPSSITAPTAVSDRHTGDVVASPTGQTDVEDAANQGTWHFKGWDKASVTIGTANEIVTGTWNFIPVPPVASYSVTYNYVSGTPDKSLPSNITAPVAVSDKHTGDVVASPTGQTDVEDAGNQGTWHFNGWDKASVTIGTANETVTGTWNFIPTPPAASYTVTYNYVSSTPDKSLPSGITAPTAVSDKHTGDVVASPSGQTDVEDTANQGTWHFKGWDKASVTIGTTNETVIGTWNFIPTPPAATYSVTYNYVSGTPDKSLPNSITAPTAVSDKHTGDVVASPTGQVDVTDSANQGTWHFKGWDKSSVTVGTTNETVTGTWNFIPTPPAATYSVTYNYVSGTPDKSLPSSITAPTAVSDKHTGDVVASPTGQVDVTDSANQGTWHFKGWDKSSVTVGTTNETVTGTWNFIPTPPAATYSVTYNYVSGTPDKSLPSGALPTTVGWIKEDNRWWYKHADGSYTANDWEQIKGIWYHFDQSGWMQTGWIQDKGTWYYLNKSGAMATGWLQENGRWYYLNNSGTMKTGWVKDNDTWYYLDNSGAMKTGWFTVSGKWYYAYSSGALAVDTTVDGYTVNANGEWV
ncbi:hypothetical protein SK642_1339 [Streptococcus mitis]|uniref:Uncharacterized protein n=1 Tax=Streptococcus mitis TaxID=28037 RepID=A0A081QAV8_STRMT|nr:SHIRT domain-containing protein [Streptococcus mitis]KEQ40081.1 hypothetical protein SK642_1339 [Streptococcus mitis]